jgi:ethanolamine-phosphate phospho-lyase
VSCAIGNAVLDIIEEENLRDNAIAVGTRLLDGLRELKEKHSIIGDVRGVGMFIGIDLVKDRTSREPATAEAQHIITRLKQEFILFSADGPNRNVLKFKPPMVLSLDDADHLLRTLDTILDEIKAAN